MIENKINKNLIVIGLIFVFTIIGMIVGYGIGYEKGIQEILDASIRVEDTKDSFNIEYIATYPTLITVPTPTVIQSIIVIPISDRTKYKFGGIPSSKEHLLIGTTLSEELTLINRNRTISVDSYGNRYYYVGNWGWFNQSEYNALNQFVKDNDLSPYTCDNPEYCNP